MSEIERAQQPDDEKKTKKKKKKLKLVARVSDIGFFQGFARSRGRLVLAALVATAVALGINYGVSAWIRSASNNHLANVVIIAMSMATLIVAAYIDAMLIGDLFFPGRWRERVLLRHEIEPTNEFAPVHVREYNAHFIIVVAAASIGLYFTAQAVTGGFFNYYKHVGYALSLMRSDNPDDRFLGLREVADPLREAHWQEPALHTQIAQLIDDPVPSVRQEAMYAAGRLGVIEAAPALLEQFEQAPDATTRSHAATALGRLGEPRAMAALAGRLRQTDVPLEEQLGILRGFALTPERQLGAAVVTFLNRCADTPDARALDEQAVIMAFFALKEMRFEGGRALARDVLMAERCAPSLQERCAAADALRFISVEDDIAFFQRAYTELPDAACESTGWTYGPEVSRWPVEGEPLRGKLVRAVGNQHSYATYNWLAAITNDEQAQQRVRKIAHDYATEMKRAFDAECGEGARVRDPQRCRLR